MLKKFEDIKVPIEVGDTVLGGRFKNKKTIVKKIGKNKKGDITINDKPLLKYRIVKEMKYLNFFENFQTEEKVSMFDKQGMMKILPKELTVINSDGEWHLKLGDFSINLVKAEIMYYQNTPVDNKDEKGDVLADGEPDTLEFDIHIFKNNDGIESNPDNLVLNIDMTYGDAPISQFSIEHVDGETSIQRKSKHNSENNLNYDKFKNKTIDVAHYTGVDSLYDKDYMWSLSDDSIQKLVDFFNMWDEKFKLSPDDFNFLDADPDSYKPDTKYLGPNN